MPQCDMSSLGPGDLSHLKYLEVLSMKRGAVRMDPKPRLLRGLENLVELNLWPNNLGRRDAEVFDGLDNLKFLDLSVAGLERVPINAFADLENLEVLLLRGNPGEPFAIRHPNFLNGNGWTRR